MMFFVFATIAVVVGLATSSTASSLQSPSTTRYSNGTAVFLYSVDQGGIDYGFFGVGTESDPEIVIQAIDGQLLFTQKFPSVVCPCSSTFGSKNFTGFFAGQTAQGQRTLQLYTSGPGAQYVYVDPTDLSLRYTAPGQAIPKGANMTSISFPGLGPKPQQSLFPTVEGTVTTANGTQVTYTGYEFCAPLDSPPRFENGIGPLKIYATLPGPSSGQLINPRCTSGAFFTSTDTPEVAPYDFEFMTPSQPLVHSYAI